jgi:hypothetical protein
VLKRMFVCFALCLSIRPIWAENDHGKNANYLALGDSLAFGFNPLVQPPDLSKYIGYPKIIAGVLGLQLTNASCPGETTSTFIGTSTVFYPGFDCVAMRDDNQLFVAYDGAPNQLDYAVAFLRATPGTKLVTIDIGLNDVGILQANCTTQFSGNAQAILTCEQNGLPGTLALVGQNLSTIFSDLRATGYKGTIVAVDAFSFNYSDLVESAAISAFNSVTEQAASPFDVTVADIYPIFEHITAPFGGDTCAAGLLVKLSDGTCDTHPNLVGQGIVAFTVLQVLERQDLK